MSKQQKLLQRFKAKPADFSWSELKSLLAGFGYELFPGGKTGGSRVKFFHSETADHYAQAASDRCFQTLSG